jgi:hypothetical protein
MGTIFPSTKAYVVASDFDQTLSFNDSGRVLSEMIGISGFDEKVAGLAKANLSFHLRFACNPALRPSSTG